MSVQQSPSVASFFDREALEVASSLIGTQLLVNGVGGVIVETEAYSQDDPASHSFKGITARNGAMFGPPGHAYVYRSYGIHWCLNFVCKPGSAVLIRALEPIWGLDVMHARRGHVVARLLCAGPGRLCQALAVTAELDGRPLDKAPFTLHLEADDVAVATAARIGLSKAVDAPWRFGLRGSRYLSRKL